MNQEFNSKPTSKKRELEKEHEHINDSTPSASLFLNDHNSAVPLQPPVKKKQKQSTSSSSPKSLHHRTLDTTATVPWQSHLPVEIWELVGKYLPIKSYLDLSQTCRKCHLINPRPSLYHPAYMESIYWLQRRPGVSPVYLAFHLDCGGGGGGGGGEGGLSQSQYNDLAKQARTYAPCGKELLRLLQRRARGVCSNWLQQRNLDLGGFGVGVLRMAAKADCIPVVEYVLEMARVGGYSVDECKECVSGDVRGSTGCRCEEMKLSREGLKTAAQYGHVGLVSWFLARKGVDPGFEDSICLRLACASGHLDVVELFIQDARANVAAQRNHALFLSVMNRNLDVAKRLLVEESVDPTARNGCLVPLCAALGDSAILAHLLKDERIDPSVHDNLTIRIAAENGNVAIVKMLLADERVDPSVEDNAAILQAAKKNHIGVVQVLIQDKRVRNRLSSFTSTSLGGSASRRSRRRRDSDSDAVDDDSSFLDDMSMLPKNMHSSSPQVYAEVIRMLLHQSSSHNVTSLAHVTTTSTSTNGGVSVQRQLPSPTSSTHSADAAVISLSTHAHGHSNAPSSSSTTIVTNTNANSNTNANTNATTTTFSQMGSIAVKPYLFYLHSSLPFH